MIKITSSNQKSRLKLLIWIPSVFTTLKKPELMDAKQASHCPLHDS